MLKKHAFVRANLHGLLELCIVGTGPARLARANQINQSYLSRHLSNDIAHVGRVKGAAHAPALELLKHLIVEIHPLLHRGGILIDVVQPFIMLATVYATVELESCERAKGDAHGVDCGPVRIGFGSGLIVIPDLYQPATRLSSAVIHRPKLTMAFQRSLKASSIRWCSTFGDALTRSSE